MSATRRVMLIFGLTALVYSAPLAAQKIYWAGEGVTRANPDGTEIETVVSSEYGGNDRGLALAPESGYFFWFGIQQDKLFRARLDGSNIQPLNSNQPNTWAMSVDSQSEKLYWAEWDSFVRADLSSMSRETVIGSVLINPRELAVDHAGGKMYWADLGGKIMRSNLDGSHPEAIVSTGLVDPWGIALDILAGKVYWTDSGSTPRRVMRSNLDGTQVDVLVEQAGVILGIAVNPVNDKLYWANDGANDIYSSNLDGEGASVLVSDAGSGLTGMAIDVSHSQLYWVDRFSRGTIRRCGLDGNGVEDVVVDIVSPVSVAIDAQSERIFWTEISDLVQKNSRIGTASLDGSNVGQVLGYMITPRGIALDAATETVYWVDSGFDIPGRIGRVRYDGTDVDVIHGVYARYSLALNPVDQEIYWTERGLVRKTDYQGSAIENLFTDWGATFTGLAVSTNEEKMYWADQSGRKIWRADLDGSDAEVIVHTDENCAPQDVTLDTVNEKIVWTCYDVLMIQRANLDGTDLEIVAPAVAREIAFNPFPHIVAANPNLGAIDARQPHEIDDATIRFGWDSMEVQFSGDTSAVGAGQFEMRETGGDGMPPSIASVTALDATTIAIHFDEPIEPGSRTCVYHIRSGTQACLGYLPGDVNGDGTTSPLDILSLIDSINGVVALPIWSTDIDRSGVTNPADVLRVIDLLNGAGEFVVWNGATLP